MDGSFDGAPEHWFNQPKNRHRVIVLLPCNFRPPFEFVTNKRWASPRSPRHTYRPVIPTIQSIDFFGGIPERSIARGSFCKRSMGEYERLVNGSEQCGHGPFALSKGASPD